jgi:hypothetical protein
MEYSALPHDELEPSRMKQGWDKRPTTVALQFNSKEDIIISSC